MYSRMSHFVFMYLIKSTSEELFWRTYRRWSLYKVQAVFALTFYGSYRKIEKTCPNGSHFSALIASDSIVTGLETNFIYILHIVDNLLTQMCPDIRMLQIRM